ncbi:MAG: hypothetical protein ACI4CY_00540 [Candidatus Gastranaerophilaceae bacterium]
MLFEAPGMLHSNKACRHKTLQNPAFNRNRKTFTPQLGIFQNIKI